MGVGPEETPHGTGNRPGFTAGAAAVQAAGVCPGQGLWCWTRRPAGWPGPGSGWSTSPYANVYPLPRCVLGHLLRRGFEGWGAHVRLDQRLKKTAAMTATDALVQAVIDLW